LPPRSREIRRGQLELLGIAESFFPSAVLFALMRLDVFARLGENGRGLDDLADELSVRPGPLSRLLNASVGLGLLETADGSRFAVPAKYRPALLPSGDDHYLGDWIRGMDYFRGAMSLLDEAVRRSGPPIDPATHIGADVESTRDFMLAMHNYATYGGAELADALDTTGCRTLLDLGCGPGTYAFHLGLRNPDLRLYLLDRADVLDIAAEVRRRFPVENQVEFLPLDALEDEIPGCYDLILVSNVLHVLGESASRSLLERLFDSVNPGGSLVVQARFLQDDRRGGEPAIFLDLLQLCITPAGHNHSVAETKAWFEAAGFVDVEFESLSMFNANSFLRGYRR
jgi:SAM-dependent methyltransferase